MRSAQSIFGQGQRTYVQEGERSMPESVVPLREGGSDSYAADIPEGAQPTSYVYAKNADGHRTVYVYLFAGDALTCTEADSDVPGDAPQTRVSVAVDDDGHRRWKICLAPADSLATGRLEPPPPPPPGGGG